MTELELRELEKILLSEEKSFGLVTKSTYTQAEQSDPDWTEYSLFLCVYKNNWLGFGGNVTIMEGEGIERTSATINIAGTINTIVTIDDILRIIDIFERNQRELICDFKQNYGSFNVQKYIDRIKEWRYSRI